MAETLHHYVTGGLILAIGRGVDDQNEVSIITIAARYARAVQELASEVAAIHFLRCVMPQIW
jgi:hypothetical protein